MSTPAVRVGQIWRDNDKRANGRQIKIVEVCAGYATAVLVVARNKDVIGARPKRHTRIRLDRFRPTSTGYVLVRDVEEQS